MINLSPITVWQTLNLIRKRLSLNDWRSVFIRVAWRGKFGQIKFAIKIMFCHYQLCFSLNAINRFSNSISLLRLDQLEQVPNKNQFSYFVILLMTAIFITQTPFYVISLFGQSKMSLLLMLSNSAINPLLYSYRMKKVRVSLISLFKKSDSDFVPPVWATFLSAVFAHLSLKQDKKFNKDKSPK